MRITATHSTSLPLDLDILSPEFLSTINHEMVSNQDDVLDYLDLCDQCPKEKTLHAWLTGRS